jgi:hypothetical protein
MTWANITFKSGDFWSPPQVNIILKDSSDTCAVMSLRSIFIHINDKSYYFWSSLPLKVNPICNMVCLEEDMCHGRKYTFSCIFLNQFTFPSTLILSFFKY